MGIRTWQGVMDDIVKDKQGPTLKRYQTALKDPALGLITDRILVETQPAEFKRVLRVGTVSTNVYLRRVQNHAVDMDWLPNRVLPKMLFPKIKHKDQRGITWDEHSRIIAREGNLERRDFYDLCGTWAGRNLTLPHYKARTSTTSAGPLPTAARRPPLWAACASARKRGR